MNNEPVKGSCLCGKVAFEFSGDFKVFQYCHCSRCRKFTGSAHACNIIVDPVQFRWSKGESAVGRYEVPEAKHHATSFCTTCGSSLPWITKSHQAVVIPAGTLDDDIAFKPTQNIFVSDRAQWYVNPDSIPSYDQLPTK